MLCKPSAGNYLTYSVASAGSVPPMTAQTFLSRVAPGQGQKLGYRNEVPVQVTVMVRITTAFSNSVGFLLFGLEESDVEQPRRVNIARISRNGREAVSNHVHNSSLCESPVGRSRDANAAYKIPVQR